MPNSVAEKLEHSPYDKENENLGENMHKRNHVLINGQTVHIQGIGSKDFGIGPKGAAKDEYSCYQ